MADQETRSQQIHAIRKARKRQKMIEFIADISNEIPTRCRLAEILGYRSNSGLYRAFRPSELDEIEAEALELRRKGYSMALARVDYGLLRRAAEGDPQAAKLCYQRFENWVPAEKKQIDLTGEMRAQAFRELLDALHAENPGFSDLFGGSREQVFIPIGGEKGKPE